MLGIYFSGTGNSRYALEVFLREYDKEAQMLAIEDETIIARIRESEGLVLSYPVQYSAIPKMLRDFIVENGELWRGKKIFIIATMGMFSGDGAGVMARLLRKYQAQIIGGLHLKMPDSISDVAALKRPLEKNKELVRQAEQKTVMAVHRMKEGGAPKEGLGFLYHMAGLFGQRLYFCQKTRHYTDKLKIDVEKCVGCAACVKACPMKNIHMDGNVAKAESRCTMCYRCINLCPRQAMTLIGRQVIEQGTIEKYL